jgi:hypothetical protein
MTLDHWIDAACADADGRGLPELKPLLTALAQATRTLRAADWNDVASAGRPTSIPTATSIPSPIPIPIPIPIPLPTAAPVNAEARPNAGGDQ